MPDILIQGSLDLFDCPKGYSSYWNIANFSQPNEMYNFKQRFVSLSDPSKFE